MTLIYYYCSYADPRSLLKPQILGNLLKQLVLKGALSEQAERELLDAYVKSGRTPTAEVLIRYILSAIEGCEDLYLVFDGLDECNNDNLRDMLDLLLRITKCERGRAHVLVTCREESQVIKLVKNWHHIHLSETVLSDDMRGFIASSVRSKIDNGELKIIDSPLEKEVVEKLAEKAHGMFGLLVSSF